jgi:hypothetical protein
MLENQLTEEEVERRLLSCENAEIMEELYSFGTVLVRQVVEDIQHVDSKAASMAAYSGAILTFLVSQQVWSITNQFAKYGTILAGLVAAAGLVLAVKARWLEEFEWFSQEDWLEASCEGK